MHNLPTELSTLYKIFVPDGCCVIHKLTENSEREGKNFGVSILDGFFPSGRYNQNFEKLLQFLHDFSISDVVFSSLFGPPPPKRDLISLCRPKFPDNA